MMRDWTRLPANSLNPKIYGRVVDVYKHTSGALLVHVRSLSFRSPQHKKIGMWYVTMDGKMLLRKSYYGEAFKFPPIAWGRKVIMKYQKGMLLCVSLLLSPSSGSSADAPPVPPGSPLTGTNGPNRTNSKPLTMPLE